MPPVWPGTRWRSPSWTVASDELSQLWQIAVARCSHEAFAAVLLGLQDLPIQLGWVGHSAPLSDSQVRALLPPSWRYSVLCCACASCRSTNASFYCFEAHCIRWLRGRGQVPNRQDASTFSTSNWGARGRCPRSRSSPRRHRQPGTQLGQRLSRLWRVATCLHHHWPGHGHLCILRRSLASLPCLDDRWVTLTPSFVTTQ
mmetsp:Transcript_3663/g.9300  ORF Transcript_3663/g.9300 Transcript_3663/m.9300 type:complete len:200 (+) Transcript_3663:639-1238(+)